MPSSRLIGLATALASLLLAAPALAAPDAHLGVAFAPGSPAPPVIGLPYRYSLNLGNTGDVALGGLVVVDTLPVELTLSAATTGAYTGLADFAAGEGVRVSYEKNTAPGVFTLWGSSPRADINTTLTAPPPGLGAGEYITRVRWEYGSAAVGMAATAAPALAGRVTNPDLAGGPVAVGDSVQNCATLTAQTVNKTSCHNFRLIAGPTVAIGAPDSTPLGTATHATATLTGGHPTGSLFIRAYAAEDVTCTTPLAENEVAVDGAGTYAGADFTAGDAGAYKWVARYDGDGLHAAAGTGCNDADGTFAVVAPPSVSASFGAADMTAGDSTPLTYTIVNPAANTVALTGVALRTTLATGLAVKSPLSGDCGGAIDAVPGSQTVALTGGTIAVGATCSFTVDVTATESGAFTTTTDAVESANGGIGNAATAELTVRAPVPAAPVAPPRPALPRALTAPELAVSCSPDRLVLQSVRVAGRRVRVRVQGLATAADAGQQVIIRALPGQTVAARATVLPDGTFAATSRLPRPRAVHKTRYAAELGARRSAALKLTRRLNARLTGSSAIRGRVAPPLDRPIRRVVIRRLTSCAGGYEVIARVKPNARGRFRVALPATAGPALYLVQTRVRAKVGGPIPTVSLVLEQQ